MQEGDLVLCTVKSIVGTTVFVTLDTGEEGSIVMSEIAPGRIRNIREYVVPGKKIVCKILEINQNNVYLSLRRVSEKERKEVQEKHEKEKTSYSIIRSVVKEKVDEIVEAIKKELQLSEFLEICKTDAKKLAKFFTEDEAKKLCKILSDKKEKRVEVKKEFLLSCKESDGLIKIKEILKGHDIIYLAAGHFSITIKAPDYKKANIELQTILTDIEQKAKKNKAEFELK